jgi:hypothetical protein
MPNQNRDPDAALRKLGHHIRLAWKKSHPTPDKTLESVRDVIRQKWEQEQQAKQRAKASVSDVSPVYFLCPRCRTKLGMNFNDRGQAVDAKGSRFRRAFLCPSCNHLVPRSFMVRLERKVRLARQPKGLNKSREPLFLDDESSF